jgi:long-chain fatty acid transport protein
MFHPRRQTLTPFMIALLACGFLAPRAVASGFQLREQSAAYMGTAYAGSSAGGQDLSSMFWNPATMAQYPGNTLTIGGTYIGVFMDLSGAQASRAPAFQPGARAINGPSTLPNAVSQPIVPSVYAAWAVGKNVTLGFSINSPFGLVTNYPDDFIGRYHGLKTDLKTYDVAPSIAIKANDQWAFGVSFVARKADANLTNAVDFGAIGNAVGFPGFAPGGADSVATLKGSTWAYGYKLGFTYQPSQDLHIGVGYQGKTTLKVDGNVSYSSVPTPFASLFPNAGGKADVNLPDTASVGFTYQVTKDFSLQGEFAWTGWSTFKELRVRFASGAPDSATDESWKNTTSYSLGGVLKVSPTLALKAGLAYDQSPVDDFHRTPRIPDANRTWATLGAAWNAGPNTVVDVSIGHIFAPTATLNLASGSTQAADNFFRGNLTGSYKVGANLAAISARFRY